MKNRVMEVFLNMMAERGYNEDQFDLFITEDVKATGSVITAEFKNGVVKFAVVKPDNIAFDADISRVSWDLNAPLGLEHLQYMKGEFDKYHPDIDSKWIYSAEGQAAAYYPTNAPRRVKHRKLAKHRQGGSFVNDTHFRKNNNSRRGY